MSVSKILSVFDLGAKVSTDTRKINPGDLFFALKGENFNGNRYAESALEAGAVLAVVDEAEFAVDGRFILVEDVLQTLQEVARTYRQRFTIPLIAITGTNGKTTTKELLHAILGSEAEVHATKGNLNNHIGVPLTLLSIKKGTEVAIIEMGASKRGDIAELCEIALPTHGLITNIGQAHLECFGNIEGVSQTKSELFNYLRDNKGFVWINEGDGRVVDLAKEIPNRCRYGGPDSDYRQVGAEYGDRGMDLKIALGSKGVLSFKSSLIGVHNAENVLAAVAVGDQMGVSVAAMQQALQTYHPKMNRTQIIQGNGFTVLLDAYNANPSSMEAALRTVAHQSHGVTVLILGDMFELGADSAWFHEELVRQCLKWLPQARLIALGASMEAALVQVEHPDSYSFAHVEAAGAEVSDLIQDCDFILVKGSRGMALERLLPSMGIEL